MAGGPAAGSADHVGRAPRQGGTRRVPELAGRCTTVPLHGSSATATCSWTRDCGRRRRPPGSCPRRSATPCGQRRAPPADKYGLDPVSLWPHLWLLMPDTARQELAGARDALDASVSAVVWSLLFIAFAVWSPWAVAAGLGVAALTLVVWVPARAATFAALVETAFDLYRQDLYARLRWPLPATPHDERGEGRRVTTYLLRGSDASTPVFTSASSAGEGTRQGEEAGTDAPQPDGVSQGGRDQPG